MDIIIRTLYGLLWIVIGILCSFGISFILVNGNNLIMKYLKNGRKIILSICGLVVLIMAYLIGHSFMFNS